MTPEQGTRQVGPGATGGGHGLAEPSGPPLTPGGPAAESALMVEHLGKRFGDRVAFDDGLEEAERLCHRVAILNTTVRLVGRPAELREQLFTSSLEVRVRAALGDPGQVFSRLPGVEGGIFLGIAAIFAQPGVAPAVFEGSHLLVQLLFTPLLAGWSIWAGIAISTRSADVRAAQQLAVLASLPPLGIVALMSFNVITPTLGLALGLAAALLIIDVLGWRAVAPMFDRERLITGTRS
jgi:hypothetical protein